MYEACSARAQPISGLPEVGVLPPVSAGVDRPGRGC
jgi:hypothetical protein